MNWDAGSAPISTRSSRAARARGATATTAALTAETTHDPFFPLAARGASTPSGWSSAPAIAIAFARTPMTMANDRQRPAARRRRAGSRSGSAARSSRTSSGGSRCRGRTPRPACASSCSRCARSGRRGTATSKLDFQGEFYTPHADDAVLRPGPEPVRTPTVMLAAVGDTMTEVAGEVADGMILHPFTTERYVREVTLPALERGFEKAGRTRADFSSACPCSWSPAPPTRRWRRPRTGTKQQIAFYGSTPAYHGVLDAARLGRPRHRAQPSSRSRASGWRWASSSPTRCSRRSRWWRARSDRRRDPRPLRRRRRPPQLRRAVPVGSRGVDVGAATAEGCRLTDDRRRRGRCPRRQLRVLRRARGARPRRHGRGVGALRPHRR